MHMDTARCLSGEKTTLIQTKGNKSQRREFTKRHSKVNIDRMNTNALES